MVRTNLEDLARANRWFGRLGGGALRLGHDVVTAWRDRRSHCSTWGRGPPTYSRPLDAGQSAVGITIIPIAVEQNRAVARFAHARGLPVACARGGTIPLAADSVDLVLVSQVAHHLEPDAVVELLRECDRVARHAVVVADLRRCVPNARIATGRAS